MEIFAQTALDSTGWLTGLLGTPNRLPVESRHRMMPVSGIGDEQPKEKRVFGIGLISGSGLEPSGERYDSVRDVRNSSDSMSM